jgi:hypothetical protein
MKGPYIHDGASLNFWIPLERWFTLKALSNNNLRLEALA